ncbi:MAG: dinitrogenase iron-molybdenum cofactor biosynthesis protein [Chlorobiales bacterium]|nr:dinitrogenase iron-molybdenum cofactor biosynthesis protein [Chlorobiales bacterium]
MGTAFSIWNGRIAPVFDVAREVLLIEAGGGNGFSERTLILPMGTVMQKLTLLAEHGVTTLVCGALSREGKFVAEAYSIKTWSFVAGAVPEVVQAWRDGLLGGQEFSMPGCCRGHSHRKRFRAHTRF